MQLFFFFTRWNQVIEYITKCFVVLTFTACQGRADTPEANSYKAPSLDASPPNP